MTYESEGPLENVARDITDGREVDWAGLAGAHPELRSRLEKLRLLQSLADSFQQPRPADRRAAAETDPPASQGATRTVRDDAADRPAGALFHWGPLEVLEKIGEGSFGEVYRAFDPMLQRDVALKLRRARAEAALSDFASHLEEARRLARVRHPHVLTIHGVEVHDGRAGLWTDFLRGGTLEQRIASGDPLPAAELAEIALDLCAALTAVHEVGLVHGDIKASNVMRETDGRVILMDFGAGSNLEAGATGLERLSGSSIEESPSFVGTPLVMAPELFEVAKPSVASDIYALGVLLYRLAGGRYPVDARSRSELMDKLRSRVRIGLSELRPDLPAGMTAAIDRTLAFEPGSRFESAAQMSDALQETLAREGSTPSRHVRPRPNNLPGSTGRFVGRDQELADLRGRVWASRLTTLTGPGGTGKTRLASHVAADLLSGFRDGAWWIELAPLTSEVQILEEMARVLQVPSDRYRTREEAFAASLSGRSFLLVLDNCEHVIEECRSIVPRLLRTAPGLRILATSRSRLDLEEEDSFAVPPLGLPEVRKRRPQDGLEITEAESVRLFIDRAFRSRPGFALTRANAPSVAGICRKLEGIPLAIELAAARMKSMNPEEVESRLEESFRFLQRTPQRPGDRGGPEHHRTLETLIAWSFDLLTPAEQALLRRLAVFSGHWTLDAAEAICGDVEPGPSDGPSQEFRGLVQGSPVLDLLESLVERSLISFEEPQAGETGGAGPERAGYRMLEIVRQYAAGELVRSGEERPYKDRHLGRFMVFAEEAVQRLNGPQQDVWFLRLERDHDNYRAAMRWAATEGDTNQGLRVATALRRLWLVRGRYAEGLGHFRALLDRPTLDAVARGRALVSAASLALWQWNEEETRRFCLEAMDLLRRAGDGRGLSSALSVLATVEGDLGNLDRAIELYEEAIALRRVLPPRSALISLLANLGVAQARKNDLRAAARSYEEALQITREFGDRPTEGACLSNLAAASRDLGDLNRALELAEEAVSILRSSENTVNFGGAVGTLGTILLALGRPEEARPLLLQSVRHQREMREPVALLHSLDGWLQILLADGRMEEAARLQGTLQSQRQRMRLPVQPLEVEGLERGLAVVRTALGEDLFRSRFASGRGMTIEEAADSFSAAAGIDPEDTADPPLGDTSRDPERTSGPAPSHPPSSAP